MIIWISLVLLLVLITVILVIATWKLSDRVLKPKVRSSSSIYDREVEKGRLDEAFFLSTKKEEFILTSRYGYKLSGIILSNEETKKLENSEKIAVLCHGYTMGKYGAICYAQMMMELGFTTVIYDHRNHGDSDKVYTTMGYFEKYDLQTVIEFCYERFGKDVRIITHGESMGASTVLNHLVINQSITCVIADCAFTDLKSLLKHQLNNYYNLPTRVFLPFASMILRIRAGFWMKDVSPMEGVMQSKTPILFIHGEDDHYVPTSMSIEMYEKRTDAKELYICSGAKHADSFEVDPVKYKQVITKFLDKYY